MHYIGFTVKYVYHGIQATRILWYLVEFNASKSWLTITSNVAIEDQNCCDITSIVTPVLL